MPLRDDKVIWQCDHVGWIKPAGPFVKHTQALRAYPPTAVDYAHRP